MEAQATSAQQESRSGPALRPRILEGGQGLAITRIGKSFRKRPVVRSVNLKLRRGEVVGLLGPNGAGKTTCFYMIMGLIPVDYGTIELDGQPITTPEALVFELGDDGLIDRITIYVQRLEDPPALAQ